MPFSKKKITEFVPRHIESKVLYGRPGISPIIKGDFTPFVYFMEVMSNVPYSGQYNILDTYISPWLTESRKELMFSSNGWCPGFLNASQIWRNYEEFKVVYSPERKQIVVCKVASQEYS